MSESCLDNEIIESLRKLSGHKKCNKPGKKERGRTFVVRQSESKKDNRMPKSCSGGGGREMSCGDYAPSFLANKTCHLQVTEPIICTIACPTESDRSETCHYDSNGCDDSNEVEHHKRRKRRCKPKLNVKKTSRIHLPASNNSSHGMTRCSCGNKMSGVKVNLARKWLGPFPDEVGVSIMDRIVQIYNRLIGSDDTGPSKYFQLVCYSSPIPNEEPNVVDPPCSEIFAACP